jgi:hypothetical protein
MKTKCNVKFYLEKRIDEKSRNLNLIQVELIYDPLRSEPRF